VGSIRDDIGLRTVDVGVGASNTDNLILVTFVGAKGYVGAGFISNGGYRTKRGGF
jgi:hypothetical protein